MIRLGIIGTGRIAKRFVPEARTIDNIEITVVCNPHIESAHRFAEENNISEYIGDIQNIIGKADAVYIATPHETHYAYAKLLLSNGIHVLCEKPMTFSEREARELFQIAKEKECILMEGIKTAYCPGFQQILEFAKSGRIGEIHDVEACFTRLYSSNTREIWNQRYGGSFTEFGTYTLLPIVKLLGKNNRQGFVWSLPCITGVDAYTKNIIEYEDAVATIKTGLGVKSEGQLIIAGTKGYILVPSPWWLTRKIEIHYEDSNNVEYYDAVFEGQGLRYEIGVFVEKILGLRIMNWNEVMNQMIGVTPSESIWMAKQMEDFLAHRTEWKQPYLDKKKMKIWGHRGCSMGYPENTLSAFRAAAELEGIAGIELDVQLTKDGEVVVIHDERVDRTTNGTGAVIDYTLNEIQKLTIQGKDGQIEYIPTLREVLELMKPFCLERGEKINIELKNSVVRYEGMEQKVLDIVDESGLGDYVLYSSFLHESMGLIKELCPAAQTGILAVSIHDCLKGAEKYHADALHPCVKALDILKGEYHVPVRAWGGDEPLFGQNVELKEKNMERYQVFGVTEIITNVPELYLN
ncbi:MAG: glycerophosphodiester phosphodiesterase family protein [Lachnospiraceae bacterium]|nr:glycerophosphodiester phosphodiesterase family protein [Lachnospiraceae bacterium]